MFAAYKRRKKDHMVPPTKFLLGGNICDPLNLNSLLDEDINRAMNAVTPKSSPLPTRKVEVEVIIPPNINDPLNLMAATEDDDYADYRNSLLVSPLKGPGGGGGGRHYKRKRRHTKSFSASDEAGSAAAVGSGGVEAVDGGSEPTSTSEAKHANVEQASMSRRRANLKPLELAKEKDSSDNVGTTDHQQSTSTNPTTPNAEKPVTSSTMNSTDTVTSSAEVTSFAKPVNEVGGKNSKPVTPSAGGGNFKNSKSVTSSVGGGSFKKCRKDSKDKIVSPAIPQPGAWGDKSHHHHHHHHRFRPPQNQRTPNFKESNARFRYGNYNRYYGYRTPSSSGGVDPRLRVLLRRRDLFEGKDVLDIGCNVGHVTLALAKEAAPRSVIGIDIDRQLIEAAKRNVKHYVSFDKNQKLPFPRAMAKMYGPLDATTDKTVFPHNVSFVQGNYVLDSDARLSLDACLQQFDTIVCLSVTKWLHLNWGDAGLKRAFRRIFAQLRPGGALVLEPQPWHSYNKKRNLTPEMWQNYKSIELFPHKFSQHLLSEVGFTKCEVLGVPHHHSKGFQRPLKLFTKGEATSSPATDTGSSATATGNSATDTGSCATATGNSATDTGSCATDTGSSATDTGNSATDTGSSATATGNSATDTGSCATDTGNSATGSSDTGNSATDVSCVASKSMNTD
ncbi:7SK snRNA methylphosphate capping enzyme [Nilaparvata lugens]|uniref:7SK snRNA methylphosphate capping enzyme n=1 Tax=Nilaparvata lugens TaxID=108931 RepID=UPI00193DA07D|nr:7SK snRNA methylphosphate capping enzyme [Nilaparvata lugens]